MRSQGKFLSCEGNDEYLYNKKLFKTTLDQQTENNDQAKQACEFIQSTNLNTLRSDTKSNSILIIPQNIKSLGIMAITIPQNILSLSVVNSYLGHKIIKVIGPYLNSLKQLRTLDISGNYIEDRGMYSLRDSGDCLQRLKAFIVCSNHISYKGALSISDFYIFSESEHIIPGNFSLRKWKKYNESKKELVDGLN